jgi:hypothetical protein
MWTRGCDFHTRYRQIAMAGGETSELLLERRLDQPKRHPDAPKRIVRLIARLTPASDRGV